VVSIEAIHKEEIGLCGGIRPVIFVANRECLRNVRWQRAIANAFNPGNAGAGFRDLHLISVTNGTNKLQSFTGKICGDKLLSAERGQTLVPYGELGGD
jgi:hypothetical protein